MKFDTLNVILLTSLICGSPRRFQSASSGGGVDHADESESTQASQILLRRQDGAVRLS